jgi:hypothetical protein
LVTWLILAPRNRLFRAERQTILLDREQILQTWTLPSMIAGT